MQIGCKNSRYFCGVNIKCTYMELKMYFFSGARRFLQTALLTSLLMVASYSVRAQGLGDELMSFAKPGETLTLKRTPDGKYFTLLRRYGEAEPVWYLYFFTHNYRCGYIKIIALDEKKLRDLLKEMAPGFDPKPGSFRIDRRSIIHWIGRSGQIYIMEVMTHDFFEQTNRL